MRRLAVALALLGLLTLACGRNTKVGSEELLDIKEQQQKERLGEILRSPESTAAASPAALGAEASPTAEAAAKAETFELTLINEHPYYLPQSNLQLSVGTVLKITNKDNKARRVKSADETYDTGDIGPGKSVEVALKTKGDFALEDPNVPFATGSLQVY